MYVYYRELQITYFDVSLNSILIKLLKGISKTNFPISIILYIERINEDGCFCNRQIVQIFRNASARW